MIRAYLLVYTDSLGTREEVKDCVDSINEVITWRFDMPYCFYLVSEYDSDDIADAIRDFFRNKGRFLVAEASDNRSGWLPSRTWYLLRHKRHKRK